MNPNKTRTCNEIAQPLIDNAKSTPAQKVVQLGQIGATPGVLEELTDEDRTGSLARHSRGDLGDVGPDDWAENDLSLTEGFRLLSAYHTSAGVKFWIITEADRSVTTILLPIE